MLDSFRNGECRHGDFKTQQMRFISLLIDVLINIVENVQNHIEIVTPHTGIIYRWWWIRVQINSMVLIVYCRVVVVGRHQQTDNDRASLRTEMILKRGKNIAFNSHLAMNGRL